MEHLFYSNDSSSMGMISCDSLHVPETVRLEKVVRNFVPGRSNRSGKSLDLHYSSFHYSVLRPLKL